MQDERTTRCLIWGLIAACGILLWPLLPALVLTLWLAEFARALHTPLTRVTRGRVRLSAVLVVTAFTAVLVPFGFVIASLAAEIYAFLRDLAASPQGELFLERLVAPANHGGRTSLWDVVMAQQARVWEVIQRVAGTTSRTVIALVVILGGIYAVLIDGARWYAWCEQHAPVGPSLFRRLRDAFVETGRGLFIGVGGAALAQSIVAAIAYVAVGVPHALELGLLTLCGAVIPAFGTAIVWVPVAAGLLLTGRTSAALVLVVVGIVVIHPVDNVVRPLLARRGHLQLPTYVVLVSMLAGVVVLGPWGLLLGPLVLRLTKALLEANRESAL